MNEKNINIYETYCKIRDYRRYKDADVALKSGVTNSTFTDWKQGRSAPKNEKLTKIAKSLGVSLEYLTGKVTTVTCPICGKIYDPVSETDEINHRKFHFKVMKLMESNTIFMDYADSKDVVGRFCSTDWETESYELFVKLYEEYLKASYTLLVLETEDVSFDYLIWSMNERDNLHLLNNVPDKYKERYLSENDVEAELEKYIATLPNKNKLVRIIPLLAMLPEDVLAMLEIQIKGLVKAMN